MFAGVSSPPAAWAGFGEAGAALFVLDPPVPIIVFWCFGAPMIAFSPEGTVESFVALFCAGEFVLGFTG